MNHADDWSWFDAPEREKADLSDHDVTAVLVCRNASSWLSSTLAGLAQLDRRPDRIVAIDNGSSDDTRAILDEALAGRTVDTVIDGKATWSFGEAVDFAVTQSEPTRWLWLLHDDAIPRATALTELLTLAARTPRLAIGVPLLIRPSRRHHIARTLEIGATISGSGRRDLGLESDEVAQGQYESRSVLGGSTCGMLVKWESFVAVGGFDPAIRGYRDGVDLGWRAQLLGEWVMTCPSAQIVHRQVGRAEIRQGTIAQQAKRSESAWDRLMGVRLIFAHARRLGRLSSWLRIMLVGVLRAVGFLLGKAPDHAKDEMLALADFAVRSGKPVRRLRKRIIALSKKSRGKDVQTRIRSLRPTISTTVESGWRAVIRGIRDLFDVETEADMTLDDLLGDEYTRRIGERRRKAPVGVWVAIVIAVIVLMSRGMIRGGIITASGLLGAPATVSEAFQLALGSDSGANAISEPWLILSAAGSVLSIRPTWFVLAALVLSFPLTTLVASWFCKYRIESTPLRWLTSAGYALLPILMGGLNRGAIWLVLLAMVMPFLIEWVQRIDMHWSGARSLQTMAGIAFSGVIIVPIMPALWIVAVGGCVLVAVFSRTKGAVIRALIASLVPVVFWVKWIPTLVRNPGRIVTGPEALLTSTPEGWQMLLGRPVSDGLPPLWISVVVFGCLWLWAIVAAWMDSVSRYAVIGGVGAIAVGMWLSHLSVPLLSSHAIPDPSPWLLLGFAVMLLTGVQRIDQFAGRLQNRDFGVGQAFLWLLSALLAISLGIGAVWSVASGMSHVVRGANPSLPEFLAQTEVEREAATLIIDAASGTWNLRTHGQTMWGQGEAPVGTLSAEEARTSASMFVTAALAGQSDEVASSYLATLGVGAVVVIDPSPTTVTALDILPNLRRATIEGSPQIWNVQGDPIPPTRMALLADGFPVQYLTPSDEIDADSPRMLVLAQPPDPALHIFVGGVEVMPMDSPDWRAAYALGTTSGRVTWTRDVPQLWMVWTQFAVVVVLIIFVFPPFGEDYGTSAGPRRGVRKAVG